MGYSCFLFLLSQNCLLSWQPGKLEDRAWKELKHIGTDLWVWALLHASEVFPAWSSCVEWDSPPQFIKKGSTLWPWIHKQDNNTITFKTYNKLNKNLYDQALKCRVLKLLNNSRLRWFPSLPSASSFFIWQVAVASVHNKILRIPGQYSSPMNLLWIATWLWQRGFCRKEIRNVAVYLQTIPALSICEDSSDHLATLSLNKDL